MSAALITSYGKYKHLSTGYVELPPYHGFDDRMDFINKMVDHLKETVKDLVLVKPLHVYNHSGVAFSTDMSGQFADRWDAGTWGFVYVTKRSLREHLGVKRLNMSHINQADTLIEQLVEGLNEY